jgi:hypothetical protein
VHRIDPNSLEVQATATTATLLSFARAAAANRGATNLVLSPEKRAALVDRDAGGGEALLVTGQRAPAPPSSDSLAVGVARESGHIVVVDASKALVDAKAIGAWVRDLGQTLGVSEWLWSVPTTKFRLGPVRADGGPMIAFRYGQPPAARRFFPQTPIVSPQVWQPLQAQRVRYFRPKTAPKPRGATAPTGAPPAPSAPGEPATESP